MDNSKYDQLTVMCKVTCDRCGIDSVKLRYCEANNGVYRDMVLCCDCIQKYRPLKEGENNASTN